MSRVSFDKILYDVEVGTEERAFAVSHNEEELIGCDSLGEVVKVVEVIPYKGLVKLKIEKKGKVLTVLSDKCNAGYFDGIEGKTIYFSGLKKRLKNTKTEKWYIRTYIDVTHIERSISTSNKFTEQEKLEFQKSIEKFSPEIQRDLGWKKMKLADKKVEEDEKEKILYKEVEELNALYNVLKKVIPPEFRQIYEESRYRLEKENSSSEKRNYLKQMTEILEFDWISNSEYRQIDIESVKKSINEMHVGHGKQLDEIYTEFMASNVSMCAPKTLNFIGRPGTGINQLAEVIGKSLGCGCSIIDLVGTRMKETESLTGTSKIYANARAGLIYEWIKKAGTRGVVIIKDFDLYDSEIRNILIPLIEKTSFLDKFVEVEINLSNLFVIVTCSSVKDIPMAVRANMTPIYFPDLTEDEMVDTINRIIVPKYCEEYNLEFTKDIPRAACRKLIYKLSNMDMNKLNGVIRSIAVKTVTKGEKAFPDYSVKEIDEFEFSVEDYKEIHDEYVREITAVENKFFTCYDEYPKCVQKKVIELFDILNWGTDEDQEEYARDCIHYLANIFKAEYQPFEIGSVVKELMKTHYLQSDFGERIEAAILSKRLENRSKRMTVIGLKGNAGTGKSSTAISIAKALKRNCVKINVGGDGGGEIIKGTRKNIQNASPSMIIKELSGNGHGSYSDVLILDELDKATPDFYNALYEFLDANEEYVYDQYLECRIPKNDFIVILTFNDISCIPLPIRDRMEVIEYSNYSIQDKKTIVTNYILPKLRDKYTIGSLGLESEALDVYIKDYDITAGMRDAERDFEYILMKLARDNNGSFENEVIITSAHIKKSLGENRSIGLNDVPPLSLGEIGMAQVLAVTSDGIGVSTAVETIVNPYQEKKVVVTGLLEGSCLESVSLACCLVSKYMKKELPKLHIHMTDAVKKDGPSAGVAITMSILSCLLDMPLPNSAFTGSIDLYGNVGAVGGVFEKCIAAERASIEKVYVPSVCYKMLIDSKQLVRLKVKVVPVDTIDEVIKYVWGMEMEV